MQIIQYNPLECHSMDVNAEYPTPGYPWTSGAAVDAEPELPALELEREVCSNFTCCGLILPDMHALVDHFEETHVFVPKPTDPRLFVLPEDRPPCPLPRLVVPFPRFLTPPPTNRVTAPYDSPASPLWSDGLPSPTVPVSYLPSSLAPTQTAPSPSLPPASFTADITRKKPLKPKSPRDRERVAGGRFKSQRPEPLSAKRRDRGRNYVCPKKDCVKTYLNPNGLKYHMEKGTCQAADGSAL